jgi:hypothetical protein
MNMLFDASESNNVYQFMTVMLMLIERETKMSDGSLVNKLFEIGVTRS